MKKDEDFHFDVSLSIDPYSSKEAVSAAVSAGKEGRILRAKLGIPEKIAFRNVSLTAGNLLSYVLNGYTFCTPHSDFPSNGDGKTYVRRDGAYTMSGKADRFFSGSNFIGVDIDKTSYESADDFVNALSMKPTFWYTSFSNQMLDEKGVTKGARFRMVYVLENKIPNKYSFRYWAGQLYHIIERDTREIIEDKCGLSASQYFNGTYIQDESLKVEYGQTNFIYSAQDVGTSNSGYLEFLSRYCDYKSPSQEQKAEIESIYQTLYPHVSTSLPANPFINYRKEEREVTERIVVDKQLFNDAGRLEWDEFYSHYKDKYPYVYRVEHPKAWQVISIEGIGEVKYQNCGSDYFELRWPTRRTKDGVMVRLTNGEHRRSTLFHRAWMRRVIMPNITPDIVFFNLMVDRNRFFDNSDGVLTVETLLNKVQQSFAHDVEYYEEKYSKVYINTLEYSKKKRRIMHWASKKVNANTLNKELLWRLLDSVYDPSISLSENLTNLNDSDINVSRSTLYRHTRGRKLNNKTDRYNQFKQLHRDGMSLRKELEF